MIPGEVDSRQIEKAREAKRVLACYAEVFSTDAGKDVLADLERLFPPDKARFSEATGFDPIKAAMIDGQGSVTKHILSHARPKTQARTAPQRAESGACFEG